MFRKKKARKKRGGGAKGRELLAHKFWANHG